jgi:hypothetical protein
MTTYLYGSLEVSGRFGRCCTRVKMQRWTRRMELYAVCEFEGNRCTGFGVMLHHTVEAVSIYIHIYTRRCNLFEVF